MDNHALEACNNFRLQQFLFLDLQHCLQSQLLCCVAFKYFLNVILWFTHNPTFFVLLLLCSQQFCLFVCFLLFLLFFFVSTSRKRRVYSDWLKMFGVIFRPEKVEMMPTFSSRNISPCFTCKIKTNESAHAQ